MTKLLSINNYHYRRGGSDVVYLEHARIFEEMGWSNAFFSMHHPKNQDSEWSRYFVDELEFGGDYGLAQKIAMGTKVIYSFEAQKKLDALISSFSPDVAHLHCIYHHLSPSILSTLAKRGVPSVMTAHDLKLACPAYKMLNSQGICEQCKGGHYVNLVKNKCIKGSTLVSSIVFAESSLHQWLGSYRKHLNAVACPSRFFMNKFIEWGWDPAKLTYIPNYVDIGQFEPQSEPGKYFLYFGRLAEEKGVATLLEAAAASGVSLKVVGTGPLDEELRAQANNRQMGNVEFLGYQSGAPLHNLVRNSRAVVLPSEWYENAPMSVLESFALGKPVIGADIGGIPEMIEHGNTGWTFPSKDIAALAEILTVVQDMPDSQLKQIGDDCREFVSRTYTKARYTQEMQALYERIGVRVAAVA